MTPEQTVRWNQLHVSLAAAEKEVERLKLRPWHQRAIELEATEGAYCDYAAWREWFSQQENKRANPGDILGGLESLDDVNLYVIFCDLFGSPPEAGEGEE